MPEVLHDINFHVQAGETIALVGRTGAGKSTIVKLLARFYDPVAGRVILMGTTCATCRRVGTAAVSASFLRKDSCSQRRSPKTYATAIRAQTANV